MTNLENVTPTEALDTLRAVVSGHEDYVYAAPAHQVQPGASCFYVHHNTETGEKSPGCVVGHVLNRLGVSLDTLMGYEGTRADQVIQDLTREDLQPTPRPHVTYLRRLLDQAQQCQDNGAPWGDALERASKVVPRDN